SLLPCTDVPTAECASRATLDRDTGQRFDTGTADRPSKSPIVKMIEFNDDGELADRCDYAEVLTEIRESPKIGGHRIEWFDPLPPGSPAKMVVLYVHGWKHNAAADDTDLMHFRHLVSDLTEQEAKAGRFRQVVGVYVGWPG